MWRKHRWELHVLPNLCPSKKRVGAFCELETQPAFSQGEFRRRIVSTAGWCAGFCQTSSKLAIASFPPKSMGRNLLWASIQQLQQLSKPWGQRVVRTNLLGIKLDLHYGINIRLSWATSGLSFRQAVPSSPLLLAGSLLTSVYYFTQIPSYFPNIAIINWQEAKYRNKTNCRRNKSLFCASFDFVSNISFLFLECHAEMERKKS